jgi:hypothetical protein
MKSKTLTKHSLSSLQSRLFTPNLGPPHFLFLVRTMVVLLLFFSVLIQPNSAEALCIDYSDYIGWETTFRSTVIGEVNDILVVEDIAYLAYGIDWSGGRLCVVDVSDPSNPQQGSLIATPYRAFGLDYVEPYLYVICADGLRIYDATVLSDPVPVGYLPMAGDPEAVSIRWPIATVVGSNPELSMVNIANPANPIFMSSLNWASGQAEDVKVVGDLAYVADSNIGLVIVDFSNYPTLVIRSSVNLPGNGHGIHLRGNYAWVLGQDAVAVLNISNPDAPTISNSTAVTGLAVDICFVTTGGWPPHTYASIATEGGTTHIFSSTDAGILVPECSVPGPYGVKCIAKDVDGSAWNYLFVGSHEQGMFVVNRKNLANPPVAGTIDLFTHQVTACGSTAYLATSNLIQTFDVSSPGSPQMLGSVSTPSGTTDMLLDGSLLYTTQGYSGLHIFDVSSPESPELLGSEPDPSHAWSLDIDWPYVYVVPGLSSGDHGLRVYNVADPTDPQLIAVEPGGWDFNSPARSVAISGSYAYVTSDSDVFLTVVDISNPAIPEVVNTLSGVGYAYSIDVEDGFAYITRFAGGLRSNLSVYNLANPESPMMVADVPVPIFSEKAWVIDEYVFLSCRYYLFGMFILDVSNPADPQPFGVVPTSARDICVTSSYLYIANNEELLIMPTQCGLFTGVEELPVFEFASLAAYPNPFNPRTTFCFELQTPAGVDLGIYDVSGRLVRTLMSGQQHSSGRFEVVWSGIDEGGQMVASGVYFCRLEAGDFRAMTRVTLVK